MRHVEVKSLCKSSRGIIQYADMKKILLINPFIKCIAGHDVKPYGDLLDPYPGIKFITLFRDPIRRYISQYQHNVEKVGDKLSFDEFLQSPTPFNKQTRTIAGSDDLKLAKDILKTRFFLVGIVEEFDEFLVLLKKKYNRSVFEPDIVFKIWPIGDLR